MSKQVFVYAPGSGEPFECSPANARDLTSHAGWSYSPPAPEAPAPETTLLLLRRLRPRKRPLHRLLRHRRSPNRLP
jgi:hypothetical protein